MWQLKSHALKDKHNHNIFTKQLRCSVNLLLPNLWGILGELQQNCCNYGLTRLDLYNLYSHDPVFFVGDNFVHFALANMI